MNRINTKYFHSSLKYILIPKKLFTFKNYKENNLDLPKEIKQHLNVNEVDSKIKYIITNYKKHKNVFSHDGKYFTQHLQFFKGIKRDDLPLILEILIFIGKNRLYQSETILKNEGSYKLRELNHPDQHKIEIPKSNYDVYKSFSNVLVSNIDYTSISFSDYYKMVKVANSNKYNNSKYLFLLSDSLKIYLDSILNSKNPTEYNIQFLENNTEYFKELIKLPYGKIYIGSLINFILEKELSNVTSNKNYNIQLSQDLLNLISSFYYNYNIEVYLKFLIASSHSFGKCHDDNNFEAAYKTILFSMKELFGKNSLKRFKNFTHENFTTIDDHLSKFLQNLYFKQNNNKNMRNMKFLDGIFNQLSSLEKINKKEIRFFPNFLSLSNEVMNEYYSHTIKNNKLKLAFSEFFLPINSIIKGYAKFYVEIKHYNFSDDQFLKKTFLDFHKILFTFFSVINEYQVKLDSEFEIATGLLQIFSTNTFNNVKDKNCENFIVSNFPVDCIKSIPLQSANRIKQQIILSYLNIENSLSSDETSKILSSFIEDFLKSDITDEIKNYYFLNLNSILYNCLLNNFNNEESIFKLSIKLLNLMKFFSMDEISFLRRLVLIIENLKIFQQGEIYKHKQLQNKFIQMEKAFGQIQNTSGTIDVWWDKKFYPDNKYNVEDIKLFIETNNLYKIEAIPHFKNLYYSDFLLKSNNKEKYIEFLSYYHLVHDKNPRKNQINKKYLKKEEIYRSYNKTLVYVPYEEIKQDLNNMTNFIE